MQIQIKDDFDLEKLQSAVSVFESGSLRTVHFVL